MTERPTIDDILTAAGIPHSDDVARRWLSLALQDIDSLPRAAQWRRRAKEHNRHLARIQNAAARLRAELEALRDHPHTWSDFWTHASFGPVQAIEIERAAVLRTIRQAEEAAEGARVNGKPGHPNDAAAQNVLRLARGLFERFSPHRPTSTTGGPFDTVAHYFYEIAFGAEPPEAAVSRHVKTVLAERRDANEGTQSAET